MRWLAILAAGTGTGVWGDTLRVAFALEWWCIWRTSRMPLD